MFESFLEILQCKLLNILHVYFYMSLWNHGFNIAEIKCHIIRMALLSTTAAVMMGVVSVNM